MNNKFVFLECTFRLKCRKSHPGRFYTVELLWVCEWFNMTSHILLVIKFYWIVVIHTIAIIYRLGKLNYILMNLIDSTVTVSFHKYGNWTFRHFIERNNEMISELPKSFIYTRIDWWIRKRSVYDCVHPSSLQSV